MPNIQLDQVSPIAGVLSGGITVTITGTGFQEGALVYFGSQQAEKIGFESPEMLTALVPPVEKPGTVAVTVINPDESQAVQVVGFMYISPVNDDRAEVFGVSPLTVIENNKTEVTLTGRKLIEAYQNGLLALRGPSRVNLAIQDVTTIEADEFGIESIVFVLQVAGTPALGPSERIAIQVLASRRPESRDDLIVESSKQMFVVLPDGIPVPLAQTPSLSKDKSTMVVFLGRNLDGCSLQFEDGVQKHFQQSEDDSLVGFVSLTPEMEKKTATQITLLDKQGNPFGEYELSLAESADLKQSDPLPTEVEFASEGVTMPLAETPRAGFAIDLVAVPNQQYLGPTADDGVVYNLNSELPASLTVDTSNFGVVVVDYWIRFTIINRVYLWSIFDVGGDDIGDIIPHAQAGRLFGMRASGVLFAARFEITIHITVIIIITIDFPWLYGGFNEFPEQFPNAIGITIGGIIIQIEIFIEIYFLSALVKPDGSLRLLFVFGLIINVHFTISTDGLRLRFGNFWHRVDYVNIHPFTDQFLCDGRFQLADDNGQTLFIDSQGGRRAYYFVHSAGVCCAPWTFNVQLIRFTSSGAEVVIRPPFNTSMCLDAAPSSKRLKVTITSVPPPVGIPPTLVMNVADFAIIKAMAEPVDESGNPTGEPPRDLREMGYDVTFYLQPLPLPQVLDPNFLLPGDALAVEEGSNVIHAATVSDPVFGPDEEAGFWFGSILGFNILQFLAQGQEPRVELGPGLPVTVEPLVGAIRIEPSLAYRDGNNVVVATNEIERYEPIEPTQRPYFLAVKPTFPAGISFPQTIKFKVKRTQMRLPGGMSTIKPLEIANADFGRGRGDVGEPQKFFTGTLVTVNHEVTKTFNSAPPANEWIEIPGFGVEPNRLEFESSQGELTHLVPPGKAVGDRDIQLCILFDPPPNTPAGDHVVISPSELKLKVVNDETFEEYLRVFVEANKLLTSITNPRIKNSVQTFYNKLQSTTTSPPSDSTLIGQGKDFWANGVDFVQNYAPDDRILYYLRLRAIALLRSHYRRHNITATDEIKKKKLNMFEWSSRGLETTDGVTASIPFPSTAARKAIVTGYDPFALPSDPDTSNLSGILAQAIHNTTLGDVAGGAPVTVKTAVMPVRYKDFDEKLIETFTASSLDSIVIFLTTSQGRNMYDLERFASKKRNAIGFPDNLNTPQTAFGDPPAGSLPTGVTASEWLESTLPYDLAITQATQQEFDGPNPSQLVGFVINQAYKVHGYNGGVQNGKLQLDSVYGTERAYRKMPDVPDDQGAGLDNGSGGSFLSNEIFYRVGLIRTRDRAFLATGHLHVPVVGNDPREVQGQTSRGQKLVEACKKAINQLLKYSYLLRAENPWDVVFSDTVINTTSQITRTIKNTKKSNVKIVSAELSVQQPFSIQLPSALPITIPSEGSIQITFNFAPTAVGDYESKLTLKEESNEVLLITAIKGTAILTPPSPVIYDFYPSMGPAGTLVSIVGINFIDVMDVRLSGVSLMFHVHSPTHISATVEDVPSGFFEVQTAHGTAASELVFFVTGFPTF